MNAQHADWFDAVQRFIVPIAGRLASKDCFHPSEKLGISSGHMIYTVVFQSAEGRFP